MTTSDNPYDLMVAPTRLDRAVDDAVAAVNALPYTDADRDADIEHARRWASIEDARDAAGVYGVVLPTATVAKVIALLRGEDTGAFTPTLLADLLGQAATQARTA